MWSWICKERKIGEGVLAFDTRRSSCERGAD